MTDLAGPGGPEPGGPEPFAHEPAARQPVVGPDGEEPTESASAENTPVLISMFSLEGRAAPGLYTVGWLGALIGPTLIAISALATGNTAAPWLFLVGLVILAVAMIAAAGAQAIERSRRDDLAYRGPSPVLVLLAVVPLGVLAVLLVVAPLSALGLDAGSAAGQAISSGLLVLMYVATIRLLVVGTGSLSWADMGLRSAPSRVVWELLVGVACVVPVLLVSGLVGLVLAQVLPVPPAVLPAPTSTLGVVLNLVTAVLLAPLGEELFFRGFSTTAWARVLGSRSAVIRGALFFAAVHAFNASGPTLTAAAGYALFSFLGVLPVAFALGALFVARRSLYAPLGLHAGYNLAIVLASMTVG